MTYRERRMRVFELTSELGRLIREAGDDKSMLWRIATDDLSDAITEGKEAVVTFDDSVLRKAFTDASRDYWLRENEHHSRKVEDRPLLKLVTPDEFESIVYPRGRGAA